MAKIDDILPDKCKLVTRKLDSVSPHPDNPRIHTEKQIENLVKSIKQRGDAKISISFQKSTGYILTGHANWEAKKRMGLSSSKMIECDFTDAEAMAWMLDDNHLSEMSTWDMPQLQANMAYLKDMEYEMEDMSWEMGEIEGYGKTTVEEDDFDVDGGLEEEPITQVGDIWCLGKHRVLCGDSTKAEAVERVMGGEKARYGMHDPPYGISVVGGANIVSANLYPAIEGDEQPFDPTLVLKFSPDSILWGANYYCNAVQPSKGWIVWDKKGRDWRDNFSDCELAWTPFGITTRIYRYIWMGMVQEGEREERVHPTQKPIGLYFQIMKDLFIENGVVLDCFLGSGPTILACEKLNKKCVGLEISPVYCDVVVKRYINHVGHSEDVFVERDGNRIAWRELNL